MYFSLQNVETEICISHNHAFSESQWTSALSSGKADLVIAHLLEVIGTRVTPLQICFQ